MILKIYNTMTKQKEDFVPISKGQVKIYACGPTVYNYIHIGNARPICVFDILRRYLEYRGYDVTFVQNFTDIDDKIINRANEEKSDFLSVAEKYIEEYKKDAKGLGVREATIHPKATENIEQIIEIIETLINKGYAYATQEGDVYFSTLSFDGYGKLSHQPLEDLQSGARIAVGEAKRDPMDFALWKSAKPGEPSWETPWGKGRPGWHIECSAMAKTYLGETIDIHCGGQDLVFPHHENEIAQSECCNGKTFANYWMHNGYINIDNKKMSKSKGNFFTVRDVAERFGYEPIRYMLISSHYRSPINYSVEIIEQCRASLDRLYNMKESLEFNLQNAVDGDLDEQLSIKLSLHKDNFIKAMDDDLNTADALAAVFDLVRDINSTIDEKATKKTCKFALNLFNELTDVLGLAQEKKTASLDDEIEELIEKRNEARKNKNWAEADKIRDELLARNIVLKDTPNGVTWSVKE